MKTLEAKAVILGAQGVGKTSIAIRYIDHRFERKPSLTIGASFFNCKVVIENYRVKLQIWDTAGQERFKAMAPMFYRNSNAAIIVYDITSSDTFREVKFWVGELKRNIEENITICIVGNKNDLRHERKISFDEASYFAESIGAEYVETSALSNDGIDEAFSRIATRVIKQCEQLNQRATQKESVTNQQLRNQVTIDSSNDIDHRTDQCHFQCCQ